MGTPLEVGQGAMECLPARKGCRKQTKPTIEQELKKNYSPSAENIRYLYWRPIKGRSRRALNKRLYKHKTKVEGYWRTDVETLEEKS